MTICRPSPHCYKNGVLKLCTISVVPSIVKDHFEKKINVPLKAPVQNLPKVLEFNKLQ